MWKEVNGSINHVSAIDSISKYGVRHTKEKITNLIKFSVYLPFLNLMSFSEIKVSILNFVDNLAVVMSKMIAGT